MAIEALPRKPVHQVFAEQIVEDLKQGVAPWQRPWRAFELFAPFNPVSGTRYSGINRLMLSRRGFVDPRWMTLRQANSQDWRVRKGEKSQTIVYWQFSTEVPARDEDGKPVLDAEGNQVKETVNLERPIVRFSSVFHVSQLVGDIPSLDTATLVPSWNPNERAELILQQSGAVIRHNQRNRAFYNHRSDQISLPPREQFSSADDYYSTALHELGHWTGHSSRLNREFGPFGSEVYAREELRAEIASWMLGQDLGTSHDPGQHLSYVASWIKALEQDPYEIVRACRDAEKIKQYVLDMELKQELGQDVSAPVRDMDSQDLDPRHAAMAVASRELPGEPDVSREPALEKVFLAVPFREKNRAKTAGAKWDPEAKLWYAPEGADLARLKAWIPVDKAPAPARTMPPTEEFAQALHAAGLDLGGQSPVMDGKIHRVPVLDGKPQARDGAYQGYLDGRPNGWYQNYLTGEKAKWKASGHTLTVEQKAALQQEAEQRSAQRERERLALHDEVAKRCQRDFSALPPIRPMASISNSYLLKKGILPLGDVRESSDATLLLIPLRNADGELRNVQEIDWSGTKRFQAGGEKKGCFFPIDPEEKLGQGEILIAEGYATGVSLHMATGSPVAVAFDAGNLEPVAQALREKHPGADIAVCADNDHRLDRQTPNIHGNVGVDKATLAARAIDGRVVVPTFTREEMEKGLTDFNDLHQARGLEAVKAQVVPALETEKRRGMER